MKFINKIHINETDVVVVVVINGFNHMYAFNHRFDYIYLSWTHSYYNFIIN